MLAVRKRKSLTSVNDLKIKYKTAAETYDSITCMHDHRYTAAVAASDSVV